MAVFAERGGRTVAELTSLESDHRLACVHPHRHLRPKDRAIASYDLPCNTQVVIWNPRAGQHATGVVLDRGPVRCRHGARPNDLDLSAALAKDLDLNGMEKVVWVVKEKRVRRERVALR